MVEWETAIGRIASVCAIDGYENIISIWAYSRIRQYAQSGMTEQIKDEFLLEQVRQEYFPECVSRLTGLYFFDSIDNVKLAIDRWGLPKERFKQLATVNFTANNLTHVDSEWVTHCLGKSGKNDKWMYSYWKGETYGQRPLTEVLASGWGLVEETERREECYKSVFKKWPKSTLLLALGATSFNCVVMGLDENCQSVSQIIPHLFFRDGLSLIHI